MWAAQLWEEKIYANFMQRSNILIDAHLSSMIRLFVVLMRPIECLIKISQIFNQVAT
jgi:hypothetical protein